MQSAHKSVTINPSAPIRLLSIVEATTINAVAKNVLEFHRVARELAAESPEFPHIEARILTFERNGKAGSSSSEFIEALYRLEIPVQVIQERKRFDLGVIRSLKRSVEQFKPDLVVTHSVKSHFLIWRSGVWRRYPWVAFHHGYTTTDLKMRAYNRLDRWSLPKANRLVTVCQAFARELADNTGVPVNQIVVQHNSVRPSSPPDIEAVESLKHQLGIADDECTVLTVGRLSREKAQADLLIAFKQLLSHADVKARLVIVGDGPDRERLEAAVDAEGLRDRVSFTGQVSNVSLYYALADVFSLPSHSEGSPNVLLEAMAADLPIVATNVGGVPEILVNHESAVLVPPADPAAMAEGIRSVWQDRELARKLTENAAALVSTHFTPDNYVRSLMQTYREVIKRNRPVRLSAD